MVDVHPLQAAGTAKFAYVSVTIVVKTVSLQQADKLFASGW